MDGVGAGVKVRCSRKVLKWKADLVECRQTYFSSHNLGHTRPGVRCDVVVPVVVDNSSSSKLLERFCNRHAIHDGLFHFVVSRDKFGHEVEGIFKQISGDHHHAFYRVAEDDVALHDVSKASMRSGQAYSSNIDALDCDRYVASENLGLGTRPNSRFAGREDLFMTLLATVTTYIEYSEE